MNNDQQQPAPMYEEQLQQIRNAQNAITDWPASLTVNNWNRRILTLMPDGEVVFGEGIEPSEAARQFWTLLAHMNPLRRTVAQLEAENTALREIVRQVASYPAIGDEQVTPQTRLLQLRDQARAILAQQSE